MNKPVRVRRLNDAEGRQLQQIVRRGGKSDRSIVKWRRAMVVLASAGGNDVAAIARLVQDLTGPGPRDDPPVQRSGDAITGPSVGGWPAPARSRRLTER
jgi:hypothetical protein